MKRPALVALASLAGAILACSIFIGGPQFPDPPVQVSPEANQGLQASWADALSDAARTGLLSLTITESQLTSFVADRLASEPTDLLSDPQVLLRDGQVEVFGRSQAGIFAANLHLVARVSVDGAGEPQIEITRAMYGPVPAPAAFVDALGAVLQQALTGALGPAATGFRLEAISVGDGMLTFSGRIK